MITLTHERRSFWLRLKLLLTLGRSTTCPPANKPTAKPKRRTHRTTAFFEMP
jgi:hypothetical protein